MLKQVGVPTQKSVARASGVSRATVGAILAGGVVAARYSEETRNRVTAAAERLDYRPHRAAQVMRKRRSNLVAIVHFGGGIEAVRKTNLALARITNEKGYDYLSLDMNWYGGSVDRTLEEIVRLRAEGVLISHTHEVFGEEHVAKLDRAGIPVVAVNGGRRRNLPQICDHAAGAFSGLVRHLIRSGHRRILQLSPATAHLASGLGRATDQRVVGFRRAIKAEGDWLSMDEGAFWSQWNQRTVLPERGVTGLTVHQDTRLYERLEKPVYRFCRRLFAAGVLPDAIVCPNDFYAMEVIAAGLECGVRVPGHLAVTGYDNDSIGEYPAFSLTTAEQDTDGICSAAMEMLVRRMTRMEPNGVRQEFDSRLIIRNSSGRAEPCSGPVRTRADLRKEHNL